MHPIIENYRIRVEQAFGSQDWERLDDNTGQVLQPAIGASQDAVFAKVQLRNAEHLVVLHRFFENGKDREPCASLFVNDEIIGVPVPLNRVDSAIPRYEQFGKFD